MDEKKFTFIQILKFISKEAASCAQGSDTNESLEVAKQCLENAFDVKPEDLENAPDIDIVQAIWKMKPKKMPSEADKKMAETLKNQGNICLNENLIDAAIDCYSKAIDLVDSSVYHCNRAAAYTHQGEYEKALADCRKAIEIDPNYSKAYGRMGLVYANQKDYQRAADSYKRALECDPGNESYQQNLQLAQSRLASTSGGAPRAGGSSTVPGAEGLASAQASFSLPGGIDLGSVMNNPMFMNMATQVMSDPSMRAQLNNMMQMFMNPQAAGPAPTTTSAPPAVPVDTNTNASAQAVPNVPDMDTLLRMGEQFAEQMRTTNPQLIDQLRGRYQQNSQSGDQSEGFDNSNSTS